jgi:glutamine synthetase
MPNTAEEVLRFVRDRDNDVKFVRLAFCDPSGTPKNISIPPDELPRAFEKGVAFDGRMFGETERTPLLFPDHLTLAVLPWRPQHGRVVRFYCDINDESGAPLPADARASLRRAVADAETAGISATFVASCDFYLFRTDEEGAPTQLPFDGGGYLDVYPLDRGENVRRDICSYLEVMSITVTSSHHARGPGQNSIAMKSVGALACADNIQTFKTVTATVAAQSGLFASLERTPLSGVADSMLSLSVAISEKSGKNRLDKLYGFAPSVNPYSQLEKIITDAKHG